MPLTLDEFAEICVTATIRKMRATNRATETAWYNREVGHFVHQELIGEILSRYDKGDSIRSIGEELHISTRDLGVFLQDKVRAIDKDRGKRRRKFGESRLTPRPNYHRKKRNAQ